MILETIIKILSDILYIDSDEIGEKTNLSMEFSLNDEDYRELAEKLEDEYDITIDIEEIVQLDTIQEIAEYIEELI